MRRLPAIALATSNTATTINAETAQHAEPEILSEFREFCV
jgi:hypothetical protein